MDKKKRYQLGILLLGENSNEIEDGNEIESPEHQPINQQKEETEEAKNDKQPRSEGLNGVQRLVRLKHPPAYLSEYVTD